MFIKSNKKFIFVPIFIVILVFINEVSLRGVNALSCGQEDAGTIVCEYCGGDMFLPGGGGVCVNDGWVRPTCASGPATYEETEGTSCVDCPIPYPKVCVTHCTLHSVAADSNCPDGFCSTWSGFIGPCPGGDGGSTSCSATRCREIAGWGGTEVAVCSSDSGGAACDALNREFYGNRSNESCPDEEPWCACCGAEIPLPASIGHVRIQGPSGLIKLNLISAADAVAAGKGVLKVARFAGDTGSAADLVETFDTAASPVRVRTPQGSKAWRGID